MLLALLIGGFLADKFGRKIMLCGGCAVVTFATWIMVFPKAFMVFIVCRVFIGVGSGIRLFNPEASKMERVIPCFRSPVIPETTARSAVPGVSPGRGLLILHYRLPSSKSLSMGEGDKIFYGMS